MKADKALDLVWPIRFLNPDSPVNETALGETFPTSREAMEAAWDDLNYDVGEILLKVGAQYDAYTYDSVAEDNGFYNATRNGFCKS